MDDNWLDTAIDWALSRHPGELPDLDLANEYLETGDNVEKALASIVIARDEFIDGHLRKRAWWRLANACNAFAAEAKRRDEDDEERAWLVVAHRIYGQIVSQGGTKFAKSLEYCAKRLEMLHVRDASAVDPVVAWRAERRAARTAPVVPSEPDAALAAAAGVPGPNPSEWTAPSDPDESFPDEVLEELPPPTPVGEEVLQVTTVTVEVATATGDLEEASYAPEDDEGILASSGTEYDRELGRRMKDWHGPDPIEPVLQGYVEYAKSKIAISPAVLHHLGPMLDEDAEVLAKLLATCGVSDEQTQIHDRARKSRTFALSSDTRLAEGLKRRRWLLAGAWNYWLWKMPNGWAANEPQVINDTLGYVTTIQIHRRFENKQRELLLASHELTVQLASQMPDLLQPYLRTWVRSAAGTYLLIGGPEPVLPSEVIYDRRIAAEEGRSTPHGYRESRDRWAAILLKGWGSDEAHVPTAAFALATLAGWNPNTLAYLLEAIAWNGSNPPHRDLATFWETQSLAVINGARPIKIIANPWDSDAGSDGNGTSMSASAPGDTLRIPNPILRAMTAQLMEPDYATIVQGNLFKGRRMPTYLVRNQFGPYGILKLDYADRVRREQRNYNEYARKRLFPNNRPSECRTGSFKLFVGAGEEPLEAIFTSFVFAEDEKPTTFALWLPKANPVDVPKFVELLFLGVLKPWLAHATRRSIDIRMEYPILRPYEADTDAHAPHLHARAELGRLLEPEVEAALGVQLNWTDRRFDDMAEAMLGRFYSSQELSIPLDELTNPLWTAAEIAELGSGTFDFRIYEQNNPLGAYSTLSSICHGDLHGENVLCSAAPGAGMPRPIVIDFETTHEGHVCRDFARLEASILCQTFTWSASQFTSLFEWFRASLDQSLGAAPEIATEDANLLNAVSAIRKLREIVAGCGQHLWPLSFEEYKLALLAALVPIGRYVTVPTPGRAFALTLAARLATSLSADLSKVES
jgi:hypothetical protein